MIDSDNYVHITRPKRKIIYLIATCRSQRHVTTCLMKFAVGERQVAIKYIILRFGCVIWT